MLTAAIAAHIRLLPPGWFKFRPDKKDRIVVKMQSKE
jgi:hypothetical protein